MSASAPALPPAASASSACGEELQALAGGHAEFPAHRKRAGPASLSPAPPRLHLAFAGDDAVEAGETFIAFLPEHEFAIPGQLVADAAVTAVDHRIGADPRMEVRVELLLLNEE